jgi:hypothetical protein
MGEEECHRAEHVDVCTSVTEPEIPVDPERTQAQS